MIMQKTSRSSELRKLRKRRDFLREKLKEHFNLPTQKRNYREFEMIVDELDDLRRKIYTFIG